MSRLIKDEASKYLSENMFQQRMQQVFAYIHQNLDKPLTLEDIAARSHFSKFHFHRVFKEISGESLGDYINRSRLQAAAYMLVKQLELSVTDIAMHFNYSSSANFSRAFKLHFGVTPKDVRDTDVDIGGRLSEKYDFQINKEQLSYALGLNSASAQIAQPYAIEEVPAMQLLALQSEQGYQVESVFQTWASLLQACEQLNIDVLQRKKIALCYDNPLFSPMEKCRYVASVVLAEDDIPSPEHPVFIKPFNRGLFAKFRYQGKVAETYKKYMEIYQQWLPSSGYAPGEQPVIEYYPKPSEQIDTNYAELKISSEIWVSIRPV